MEAFSSTTADAERWKSHVQNSWINERKDSRQTGENRVFEVLLISVFSPLMSFWGVVFYLHSSSANLLAKNKAAWGFLCLAVRECKIKYVTMNCH